MSPTLQSVKPNEVLRALNKAGFYIHHQTGSHVVLPYHNKDLRKGTLRSILKEAGLSIDEFIDLL